MERSSASSKSVKASTEDAAPCVEESTKSTGTNSWQRSFVNQLFARTVETSYGKNHLDSVISSKSELKFQGVRQARLPVPRYGFNQNLLLSVSVHICFINNDMSSTGPQSWVQSIQK
jgi:hypothetical protein